MFICNIAFNNPSKAIDWIWIQSIWILSLALFEIKLTKDFDHIAINNIKVNLNLNWSKMINKSFEQYGNSNSDYCSSDSEGVTVLH